jgi:hypothetical protein
MQGDPGDKKRASVAPAPSRPQLRGGGCRPERSGGIMKVMNNGDTAPEGRGRAPRTAWMYIREGLSRAQRRRPVSFYLLLAMPVALVAAAGLLDKSDARQFFGVLALLIVFFGIVMIRAVGDLFDIARALLREERQSFRDTLGEPAFAQALGARVKQAQESAQE